MCTTVFLPVRALNCDTEYSMYVQHNLRVDETAISIKFRVDEMKGIVTNVATHRGDIEKMVEKIIEFEVLDPVWFEILRRHPELQVDSDGNTIPLKRNHRINHFYQRALNRSVDLNNYPRDEATIPAVIRECFTDIQSTRDYIITTSSSGYVRVLNSISLREITSMDVFSLNLHREGGQGNPPEGMIYAPLSHLRILSSAVFEQSLNIDGADPAGLKTAAGRNAANTNGDRSSSDHISPTVSSFAVSSRHVVLSIVSLEPAPLSAEAAAEAQAALAAAAAKKKPPPAKGAAEQPIVESATLYRLLVLDILKHEETHGDVKEGEEQKGKGRERVGVQVTQQVDGRQATGETIAQPARIEVINELFLQLPSSSSVSSADTVHELMPSLMWDRIGVELSKDGCFMSVVGLPLGEACKLYALQPPKKIEVAMGMTMAMTMMGQSSNSTDQLPDDELLLQEIPAVTVTSPVVIGHLPSNAPFLLGGRLKSVRMVPNYRTLLNRDAAKQKMKTMTTEMMKEAREEAHRDSSYLLLKAFTEQTMLVVSLQDVHAALIVGLRLKSEDELVAKVSSAPLVLDAKGKAKPPDIKAPSSNATAEDKDKDYPTPIDLYLISQFKLTAALTVYAVDCSLRVLLATGTSDGTVTLWNLAQLSMVDCLGKHPSAVTCLSIQRNHVPHLTALSKASVSVVSGAVDGTLCFFKAEAVGAGVGAGVATAATSRASQLSVTIKGEHSPSPPSPPAHRRRDRSTSTTPGGGTAGILSRRRLDTAASRPSLLSDSSREGLEAIEHVVLKDYRSDVVVDTAAAAAVGAACVLDIKHHDYLSLVYVQYSNGMMVMYDCLNLQLLGRLEKRERINYVNIYSVMTSAHTLQGFDDPVKRAAAIQKAIDDAAAAERQRIELLEQLAKAAAVEAEKAKKAGKPVPEPVITPAVVGVAAKVEEEEVSKNANKDRGGIDYDDDDDLSVSAAAAVELTENEINAVPYDAIRGKIIDSKTARFTYDSTWHTHRFLMTITHGHVVCLSERRGLVNIVMYPLDAMVDDMLSSAAAQGSHSVASAPLNTGKAATSVPKSSSAMSKRVADTYSHLDHTMTSIDGKGTLKPLGKLRLTEERLHALDSSIAAVPVAADRRGDMDRDIIIISSSSSHSHTAASSHRDLFFSRWAFDQQQQQQSISAQTPFQLLQLNAVIVDPERIAQTAMVRSKQERERRKAKVQASSKVLANMMKPAVA